MTTSLPLPAFCYVPAQPFLMGTPEAALSALAQRYGGTRESYREESPQFSLTLPAFAIAQTPVTHELYAAFVADTATPPPGIWRGPDLPAGLVNHPVVDIDWQQAQAFCNWLTAQHLPLSIKGGKGGASEQIKLVAPRFRLPTEAEWEQAARGTDGRTFPWGDTFDAVHTNTREAQQNGTTPVGDYPTGASPYGLLDMAGNVWELTSTLDALYPYTMADGREDLEAPGRRIARGGCYANPQGFARCACRFRFPPNLRNPFLGFRLAVTLE